VLISGRLAVYQYYQKEYFDALTELRLAKVRGGIQGHGDNPAIIEGGIDLAFGMQATATGIFKQLLDDSKPAKVRNTAWFYLAKLAYMRGKWDEADTSLAKLNKETMSPVMADEAQSIAINLLIRNGRLAEAADQIKAVPPSSLWFGILNYNLASALGRAQRFEEALPYYEAVYDRKITTDYPDPEIPLALHDRARTAAGYSLIALENYYRAYVTFDRVRLTDIQANEALLGSGWAAFNLDRLDQALAAWQELLRRGLIYPEVQEAQMAIPYAYEKLGAAGEALLGYASAETAYEQELERIQAAKQQLQNGNLLDMLGLKTSRNSSWLEGVEPDVHQVINYVHKLVAQNQFQADTQRLRDLQGMKNELDQWQVKLDDYEDLTQARVDNRVQQADTVAAMDYPGTIAKLNDQRWALQTEIDRIQNQKDYLALTPDENRDLAERARNLLAASQQYSSELNQEQIDKAKLLYGVIYWQQAQNYHASLYQAQTNLAAVNLELEQLQQSYERVQGLVNEAPDLAPMAGRLALMQGRVETEQAELDRTMASLSDSLKQTLLAELETQRQRVTFFLSEARLAIARLYDGRIVDPDAKPGGNKTAIDPTSPLDPGANTDGDEIDPDIEQEIDTEIDPEHMKEGGAS